MHDKPTYVGVTVPELSKWLRYDFCYNLLINEDQRMRIIYVNTGSFLIESDGNIYEIIKINAHKFDTSDYLPGNVHNIIPNSKKGLDLIKDENAGRIMIKFTGLKAKTYAYIVNDEDNNKEREVKKVKGFYALVRQ